jgi:hypothetical protein
MECLYDENVVDEKDHIFYEPFEIHENTNIKLAFTTSSFLQLKVEYCICNSMKTKYVVNACDLLGPMHKS